MICRETLVLLLIVTLLTFTIFMMYNKTKSDVPENFESSAVIEDLLTQYQNLTEDQKKQLAQLIGLPMNGDDMIHKSAIPPQRECPASEFNEFDYVKRSSIPPCPEAKPCIAPKVVIDADLCKKQECPPCPTCQECSRVETNQVPVFIVKTVKVDADGNEISTTVEQSDVELGEGLLASGSGNQSTETTVSSPNSTETTEPEASDSSSSGGFLGGLGNRLFGV